MRFVCPLGRLPLTYRDADQAGAMLQGISSGRGPMRSLRAIRASHVGSGPGPIYALTTTDSVTVPLDAVLWLDDKHSA